MGHQFGPILIRNQGCNSVFAEAENSAIVVEDLLQLTFFDQFVDAKLSLLLISKIIILPRIINYDNGKFIRLATDSCGANLSKY